MTGLEVAKPTLWPMGLPIANQPPPQGQKKKRFRVWSLRVVSATLILLFGVVKSPPRAIGLSYFNFFFFFFLIRHGIRIGFSEVFF